MKISRFFAILFVVTMLSGAGFGPPATLSLTYPMLNSVEAKSLIENGADVNAKDSSGNTALHLAIIF